jgi:hypothetical protein
MDDQDAPARAAMRQAEAAVLKRLGIPDAERFGADRCEPRADEPRADEPRADEPRADEPVGET